MSVTRTPGRGQLFTPTIIPPREFTLASSAFDPLGIVDYLASNVNIVVSTVTDRELFRVYACGASIEIAATTQAVSIREDRMRVALYSRVSTDRQETENQVIQLRDFAVRQGWTVVYEYSDVASGGKSDRDGLKHMFDAASKREFDLVLFWALDRLSREGVLETLNYLRRLESYGVGFRSYTEQFFDSCGVFKDCVISIMATLAKQERIKRSERTKAGLAIARNRGKRLGRPGKTVSPATVLALRQGGASLRSIAKIHRYIPHARCRAV
jgi:DNA invertase Pin-like site-specific DNA recombinase